MTELHLLNVPFEANYKDTVYFATKTDQETYMRNHRVSGRSNTDFNYQRKDNIIRYPAHIDTLYECNYVQYKNSNGKYMYAFITDMKYINDERTDISIETDVIQSWMFNKDGTKGYIVKSSFVEREHVDDDAIGVNTVPEQLETGEYVCGGRVDEGSLTTKGIILACTIDLASPMEEKKFTNAGGNYYNGVYCGVDYYYFAPITNEDGRNPFSHLNRVLTSIADAGQSDSVVSIFMVPASMVRMTLITTGEFNGIGIYSVDWSNTSIDREWAYYTDAQPIKKPNALGVYTPRNKKLLTYPYCYLLGSNNSGGSNVYHYELFGSGDINFKIRGSVTPGMSIRMIPMNYSNLAENNNEGLNLGKFPICAWTTDVYTNWLTQNSVNVMASYITGASQIVGGLALTLGTGGLGGVVGGGTVVGGIASITSTMGQVYQHSKVPPASEGNINSGDVTYGSGLLTFSLYMMRIKEEYARMIDDYFDMFGYKVNRVKVPNKNHRSRYWYTKTIDVNIDGAIPNKDLEKIKECYDRGITFWRANTTMGDYSENNNIL